MGTFFAMLFHNIFLCFLFFNFNFFYVSFIIFICDAKVGYFGYAMRVLLQNFAWSFAIFFYLPLTWGIKKYLFSFQTQTT
jgi:hypothetical protein